MIFVGFQFLNLNLLLAVVFNGTFRALLFIRLTITPKISCGSSSRMKYKEPAFYETSTRRPGWAVKVND